MSIVIPSTLRRTVVSEAVGAAVSAVSARDGGEVLVVANGPTGGRLPLDVRSSRLRVIESPIPATAAARNLGMREAGNDVVLFTDDDCLVSAEWSDRLTERLRNGAVATATPLRMRRDGPITAFIDYQRVYYPPPIDASTVRYPVGASIGVRRDLVGVSFDEGLFSGEDAEFGRGVRSAGATIPLVREAPGPIHLLPERIESITGRFLRYGRGNAARFLLRDRPSISVPHATSLYASLAGNAPLMQRRFEEIVDAGLREVFATYDLLLLSSFLIGYLGEAGKILGREIVRADEDALAAAWREIASRLEHAAAHHEDWDLLPIDFDRWRTPHAGRQPALAADVARSLAELAPLAEPPGLDPALDVWADPVARRAEETWVSSNRIWREVQGGDLAPQLEPIATRLRAAGIPFREGAQTIERIAQGPLSTMPRRP